MTRDETQRTFVTLDTHERKIVRDLQALMELRTGKKPSMNDVLRGVLRDYWQILDGAEKPALFN